MMWRWPRWMGGGSLPLTLPLVFALSVAACGGDGGGPGEDPVPPDDLIPGETISYTAQRSNPWGFAINEEPDYSGRAQRKWPHEGKKATLHTLHRKGKQAWYSRIEAIDPGQWWPIGRHFARFIGYHQGAVAIGRVLPVPALRSTAEELTHAQGGPDPIIMVPGMDIGTGGVEMRVDQLTANSVVLSRYRSDAAPIPENYMDTITVREGDIAPVWWKFSLKVVAFHPAVGDLPAYAEARLEIRAPYRDQ